MFSSLARSNRIGAFCSRNIPRHNRQGGDAKLSMSTSQVDLERVAGDTVGGSGTTLVPKVRCCVPERPVLALTAVVIVYCLLRRSLRDPEERIVFLDARLH